MGEWFDEKKCRQSINVLLIDITCAIDIETSSSMTRESLQLRYALKIWGEYSGRTLSSARQRWTRLWEA